MQAQHFDDKQTQDQQESYTISQVAHMIGMNAKAIRYYEGIGLLPPPARSSNQYRRYSMADVNRLILLRRIRYLGVPLIEARPLLQGATEARRSQVQQNLLDLVQIRLAALDREIAELHLLREELEQYQRKLASCQPDEQEPFCRSIRRAAALWTMSSGFGRPGSHLDRRSECNRRVVGARGGW